MDINITFVFAIIFLAFAILYVTLKNRDRNQKIENREKNIELIIYKKEIEILEEKLRRNEISWDNFIRLRKNLEEQHLKNMVQINKSEF